MFCSPTVLSEVGSSQAALYTANTKLSESKKKLLIIIYNFVNLNVSNLTPPDGATNSEPGILFDRAQAQEKPPAQHPLRRPNLDQLAEKV
jgi:hypothetical protein